MRKHRSSSKLNVRHETIRSLRTVDLDRVAGGDSGDKGCTTEPVIAAGTAAQTVCTIC